LTEKKKKLKLKNTNRSLKLRGQDERLPAFLLNENPIMSKIQEGSGKQWTERFVQLLLAVVLAKTTFRDSNNALKLRLPQFADANKSLLSSSLKDMESRDITRILMK